MKLGLERGLRIARNQVKLEQLGFQFSRFSQNFKVSAFSTEVWWTNPKWHNKLHRTTPWQSHRRRNLRGYISVQFSSVVSNSLRDYELEHTRPPCPSPTPRVHSNSHPSSQWCHPAISSSVIPFSSCPNPSQHQSLFQWVNSLHKVAKVLEFQLKYHSFQWTPRTDLL